MRTNRYFLVLAAYLTGCYGPEGIGPDSRMMNCVEDGGKPGDLSPSSLCTAAKGLAGTNLLCADFDKVTQLNAPTLTDWNFNAIKTNCWEIKDGALQVQNFSMFTGNCGATLPSFDLTTLNMQYKSVTLSLLHQVDMNENEQYALVYLDTDTPLRLAHQMTGKPGFPTLLTSTLTINKADLPQQLNSTYKFFLKVSSSTTSNRKGWQIKSIAINGNL